MTETIYRRLLMIEKQLCDALALVTILKNEMERGQNDEEKMREAQAIAEEVGI